MKFPSFAATATLAVLSGFAAPVWGALPQTLTFVAVPSHDYGDVFAIYPTTNATGLVPTVTVVSGPATVSDHTVITTGVGKVTLQATEPGNSVYAAAAPVTQDFEVMRAPATVLLSALAQSFDGTEKRAIATTAPTLLPVIVTYNGSTAAPTKAGSYFAIATINDANYQGFATGTLIIGPGGQSISFGAVPIPTHVFGDVPFTITPTASSGLPVTLNVISGPATLTGNIVTLIGAGTVVLQATQFGNGTYAYATVAQSFEVTKPFAPVLLENLAQVFNGSARAVAASTTPANLLVKLTYNGGAIAPTAPGSYAVVAEIDDANYQGLAAGTLTVAAGPTTGLAAQAISFGATLFANHTFGDPSFTINPTSSSGLPVTTTVVSGPATVSGNTVTLIGAGRVTLLASQVGNGAYSPTSIAQVFNVTKALAKVTIIGIASLSDGTFYLNTTTAPIGLLVTTTYNGSTTPPSAFGNYSILATVDSLNYQGVAGGTLVIGPHAQTIAFSEIPDRTFGDPPFDLQPTATSGLPVVLSVVSGPAFVSGQTVTLTGVGTVILQAMQNGNTNFQATSVTQSFAINAGHTQGPLITVAPFSQTAVIGDTVNFTVTGIGQPAPTYQWFLNSLPIVGATQATLTISNLQPASAGAYTVTLTNAAGVSTTRAATLNLNTALDVAKGRLVNFSARAMSSAGDQVLMVGFVTIGSHKSVLIRGVGPTLKSFGIQNALVDPTLVLYDASGATAANDNWENSNDGGLIPATSARSGAFSLPSGSDDSALIATLNQGVHTISVAGSDGGAGIALAEVYDIDANFDARLLNLSARARVFPGEGQLFAGFVIAGNTAKTVLIRGVGPTLAAFGVRDALADPKLSVFAGSTLVASNDNWETGTSTPEQLMTSSAQVGAFTLLRGSKDASLLITLPPGAYTAQLGSVDNTAGIALIEIYDVQ
jgi:hypothetical protein